jgi:glyoxalase family protein
MEQKILGLHHITAIAGNAQRNHDFYTNVLGLRFVKKTINFDDPGTYHFYYGNADAQPGSILTFFPWEDSGKGQDGTGMATDIGYSVPSGSLDFWAERFKELNVNVGEKGERFGEMYLSFTDPDGLNISLIVPKYEDTRNAWETKNVKKENATKGFHSATLTLQSIDATAKILTDIFGYTLQSQEGNRYRFITDAVTEAAVIDLLEEPNGNRGVNAGGTNHHVAFRVKDQAMQMELGSAF